MHCYAVQILEPQTGKILARCALMKRRRFVMPTARRVFGDGREAQPDAIEVVAYRLRKKIAGLDVELVALRGVGYLIREKRPE